MTSAPAPAPLITKFETDQEYEKGDLLYSTNHGIFTTRKIEENSILLGLVNDSHLDDKDCIEVRLI